jgi:hypothetical protein
MQTLLKRKNPGVDNSETEFQTHYSGEQNSVWQS